MRIFLILMVLIATPKLLLAQKVEFSPYVALHNSLTEVASTKHTRSFAEPAKYKAFGPSGISESNLGLGAGVYLTAVAKNHWGLQSGVRVFQANNRLNYRQFLEKGFITANAYKFSYYCSEVPLHFVYDFQRSAGNTLGNGKIQSSTKLFGGPLFGYTFWDKTEVSANSEVYDGFITYSSGFSDNITRKRFLYGFEFGVTMAPIFTDWLSLSLVYSNYRTPVSIINYESYVEFENANVSVRDFNQGNMTANASRFSLQIGLKPFNLKALSPN